ncbi:ABC transporter ATP-binding protein [Slackia heliotrinireducens]|uniref:ABC transporter ATP-binding protein n=1 Tax=Slackia heliotrinireducens TaxID=84110 RepID=UPI003315D69E
MPAPSGRGPGGPGAVFLTEEEKRNQPKLTWPLIKRVFSYFGPYKWRLALILVCIVASSVLSLLPTILTGKIIDDGLIGRNLAVLVQLILLSFGVTVVAQLIGVAESYLNSWVSQHIGYDMRNAMYRHLQTMSQRFFTTNNQGDIITRMTSDIAGAESVISSNLSSVLSNTITLIVAMVAMFSKNWILALVSIALIPLFVIPTRRAGRVRWNLTSQAQECNDQINGILNETLSVSGQTLVKLFGAEDREYERYEAANKKMIGLNIKESMAGRWFFVTMHTISSVGPMLLYLGGGILMMRYDSSLTVGDITVMVTLLGRMYGPVNSLLNIQVNWVRSMAMFTRIFEYFDMKPEVENAPDAIVPDHAEGSVAFEHVDFAYDPERQILHDVSFTLDKGKSIALVGPSGSGKSTIVNLIPRLYDVAAGSVKFDGVDVRQLDLHFLRANVGVVTQETYLFNGTIRDNLLYVKPDATEEELLEVCDKANILEFIQRQEHGLDTMVGNRGLKLSGGEKQRISIARVLLKDPALLIFDEATSALDSISEAKIQDAINSLVQTHTSILIAHRLSTILAADEILVIKDGHVVERGQHADLVKTGGVYSQLYDTQFKGATVPDLGKPAFEPPAEEEFAYEPMFGRDFDAMYEDADPDLALRLQESERERRVIGRLYENDPYLELASYFGPPFCFTRK